MSAEQERVEEDGGNAEPALWQSRWLNPTGADVHPTQLAWQEIKPWIAGQTLQERVAELRDFRWEGRPAYEVRALVVAAAPGAAAAEPTEQTVNRATVIEWLDALDIEVTDRQLAGLFDAARAAQAQGGAA